MIDTLTDRDTPPMNDALLDELDTLRTQRARLLAYLRTEKAGGATVVRVERVAGALGARL